MQRITAFGLLFIAASCGTGVENGGSDGSHPGSSGGTQAGGGAQASGGSQASGGAQASGGQASGGQASGGRGGIGPGGRGGSSGNGGRSGGASGTGGGGGGGRGVGGAGGMASAGRGSAGGGAASGGQSGARSNPLSQNLIDAFVTAHNQARSGPLAPAPSPPLAPVSWDYILADAAYNYTTKCQGTNGLLSHNANRTADYRALGGQDNYVGENIYGTSSSTVLPQDAVSLWMDEASSYDYNANNIGAAGHYTQVVWRSSVRIGCAIFNCPALTYRNTILCDYAPGGNITGQKPY